MLILAGGCAQFGVRQFRNGQCTARTGIIPAPRAVHYSLAIVGGVSQMAAGVLLLAGLKRYRLSLEYLKEWNDIRADET